METVPNQLTDHDLLIVVHTKMDRVQSDIREIKDNLAGRVSVLEFQKLDKADADKIVKQVLDSSDKIHNDLGGRLTVVERDMENMDKKIDVFIARIATWGAAALLALGVVEFVLNKFIFK